MMSEEQPLIDFSQIPEYEMKALCRTLLQSCREFYSDPKNVEKFERWKQSVTRKTEKRCDDVQDDNRKRSWQRPQSAGLQRHRHAQEALHLALFALGAELRDIADDRVAQAEVHHADVGDKVAQHLVQARLIAPEHLHDVRGEAQAAGDIARDTR